MRRCQPPLVSNVSGSWEGRIGRPSTVKQPMTEITVWGREVCAFRGQVDSAFAGCSIFNEPNKITVFSCNSYFPEILQWTSFLYELPQYPCTHNCCCLYTYNSLWVVWRLLRYGTNIAKLIAPFVSTTRILKALHAWNWAYVNISGRSAATAPSDRKSHLQSSIYWAVHDSFHIRNKTARNFFRIITLSYRKLYQW